MNFFQKHFLFFQLKLIAYAILFCGGVIIVFGMRQGLRLYSVESNSMAPSIVLGDAVIVDTRDREVSKGDVIAYYLPNEPRVVITHRVVSVDKPRGIFTARGDSSSIADPTVPDRAIIGSVTYQIPNAGHIFSFLKNPLGLILTIYLPALGIVAAEARQFARSLKYPPVHYVRYGAVHSRS